MASVWEFTSAAEGPPRSCGASRADHPASVLLDLTSNWPVVNGAAAAAMMMNDKASTQAWARAICERHGDVLDGLYHQSTINNEPLVTLFSRTERVSAFPARVRFSARLSDATADEIVAQATKNLGYASL